VRRLTNRGFTVYGNTPLLGGVNDTPDSINALAYGYRQAGIEFHHLYLAGQPLQTSWNAQHPIDLYDVVDIAIRVRREGSGREIPRYVIVTGLGEVDFGLASSFTGVGENLSVKLAPYDLAYYTGMDPAFTWPANVTIADDGKPVVPVTGHKKTTTFALS
jgi:L-lysine 2,3-aminomutase